ncbi:LysR family transcriptional regulator [Salibacterium halotolerans]|uniref:DNA-binding transcriptional regulator, LysR family n=1 Tax=Salibacterium halotolerans TaxID=1884432 RepID=A0A1I5LI06_9BACI|nr:LysR family transcriptional regulator [Salibacterium halotolerans]SFO96823.1 DNA-binding transcriptional regulator, LysR family [Salibacterium halotolerans]
MNLQMLEYFLTAAKEKSITKAADILFVSQPALSKQVSKLEETLGFPLFIRTSKGISLTHKGQKLYDDVEPTLRKLQSELYSHMHDREIRMGSDPFLASYFFPDYIEQANPFNIKLTYVKDDSLELLPLLESGGIDAAVIQDVARHKGLQSTFLFHDTFFAAVSSNHDLAQQHMVSISDCLLYTQLLPPASTPLYKRIHLLAEEQGYTVPPVIELPYHALIGFAAQGYGVTYLPSIMVKKIQYKGVEFLPIENNPIQREMHLYALDSSTLKILKTGFDT